MREREREREDTLTNLFKKSIFRHGWLRGKLMSNLYAKPWYPVGAILEFDRPMDMTAIYGGTWELFGAGRMTVGIDTGDADFNSAGKTGGSKTHTQTVDEMPSHGHSMTNLNHDQNWRAALNLIFPNIDTTGWPSAVYVYPSNGLGTTGVGGSQPMDIKNPYIVVYRYRKVAN